MQSQQFICPNHSQQPIIFVCAVNDWHFQSLCQLCLPTHTKNHSKRLNINLQTFQDINNKVNQRKGKVIEQYKGEMNKIQEILKGQIGKNQNIQIIIQGQQTQFMKNLNFLQDKMINHVKSIFGTIKQQYKQSQKSFLGENKSKILTLHDNLQKQINFIQCKQQQQQFSTKISKFDTWKNSVKKIYFVQKSQSYIEQAKQIYEQYNQKMKQFQKVYNKAIKTFVDNQAKVVKQIQKLIITSGLKFQLIKVDQKQQNQNKIVGSQKNITGKSRSSVNNDAIKKPIPKPKKKLCKNCNQQMQYLTQNHKHLICKSCNYKQRNYTKKII